MIIQLPIFKGYTVDARLREFRRINSIGELEFLPFDSKEGERLLNDFILTIDENTQQGKELLVSLW